MSMQGARIALLGVVVLALGGVVAPLGAAGQEVNVPDANLRAVLLDELGKSPGDPITQSDMEQITTLLTAGGRGIEDLTGLEYAVNMVSLNLNGNNVSDISPLAGLSSLDWLNMNGNNMTSAEGFADLPNIRLLFLGGNSISDVTPLASLTGLEWLHLYSNNISDVTALGGLTNLRNLWLYNNNITSISALDGLSLSISFQVHQNYLDVSVGSPARAIIDSFEALGADIQYEPQKGLPVEFTVDPEVLALNEGDSTEIAVDVTRPGDGFSIAFESTDDAVASVDGDGVVSAVGEGTAEIRVTVDADGYGAVTVSIPVTVIPLGALEVTIEPEEAVTAGAQWTVDGGATWHDSGVVIDLAEGDYNVVFSDLTGWTAPSSQAVTVEGGETAAATGVYAETAPGAGGLRVDIEPQGAVDAGAQWSIDDGDTWRDSGEVVELAAGDYTVTFSEVTGWIAPDSAQQAVEESETATVTGTYTAITYTLMYSAGANGSIEGPTEQTVQHGQDGEPVEAVPDAGYGFTEWSDGVTDNPRTDTNVTGDISVTAEFEERTGFVEVTLTPQGVVDAGAQWSIDGGETWRDSGDSVETPIGDYTVVYAEVDEWLEPESEAITVEANETETLTGTYLDFGLRGFSPDTGLSLGGTIITAEVVGLTEDTVLYIGSEPTFPADGTDLDEGLLVVETPSQWPLEGGYEVRVEDTETGAEHTFAERFTYVSNPFAEDADQFPGEMRLVQDTPEGVSTAGGSLPKEGDGTLLPLEYETPEGVVIEIPVEALPANNGSEVTGAYVVVRSASDVDAIFGESIVLPEGLSARSPYVDVHILVELDGGGEDFEVDETAAPVILRFPPDVDEQGQGSLTLGRMITNADEQFLPILPDPAEILEAEPTEALETDDEGRLVAGVTEFTAYGLLGPETTGVFADVNNDGVVNAIDIQLVINAALGIPINPEYNADVNNDGAVNALDVQLVINAALGISPN